MNQANDELDRVENAHAEAMWQNLLQYPNHDQNLDEIFYYRVDGLVKTTNLELSRNYRVVLHARLGELETTEKEENKRNAILKEERDKYKLVCTFPHILVSQVIYVSKLKPSTVIRNVFFKLATKIVEEIPKEDCKIEGTKSFRLSKVIEKLANKEIDNALGCKKVLIVENFNKIILTAQGTVENRPGGPHYRNFHIFVINCWNRFYKNIMATQPLEKAVRDFFELETKPAFRDERGTLENLWPVVKLWLLSDEGFESPAKRDDSRIPSWGECFEQVVQALQDIGRSEPSNSYKADIIDGLMTRHNLRPSLAS